MQYTPLAPAPAAALVLVAFAWSLYRLWLGQEFRSSPDWSPWLDAVAWGAVALSAVLVARRVAGL